MPLFAEAQTRFAWITLTGRRLPDLAEVLLGTVSLSPCAMFKIWSRDSYDGAYGKTPGEKGGSRGSVH